MTTELVKQVHWVGWVDWPVRDFHGYQTKRGSSYNAYLVRGTAKTALIDTVKAPFAEQLKAHITAHCPLEAIDYIVCNHAEPDHSGSLPAIVAACPNAVVVCNAKCRDALSRHYDVSSWSFQVVKEGETLDLGGRTLQFFDTVMCHWPSMVTFLQEESLLFSMDIFGQHYASSARFDDEADLAEVMQEAKTYYANIVLPYAKPVANAAKKLLALNPRIVAPSHGVIWRSHVSEIVQAYLRWHVSTPTRKVVIFYATMWQSTRRMAEAIAEGANASEGVEVKLFDLKAVGDTELITELMDCAAFACGTPTLNQGLMPRVAAALTYIRGLKPAGKSALAFGSFGWASKGAEEAHGYLQATGCTLLSEPITCRFAPDAETLERCRQAGKLLAGVAAEIKG